MNPWDIPWDIVKYERDPLGGPDVVVFADGYRMPIKPKIGLNMTDDFDNITASGFKFIKDMSKEQIIEEIVNSFKVDMQYKDVKELREILVKIRVTNYKERTLKEAGFIEKPGILGIQYVTEDEEQGY